MRVGESPRKMWDDHKLSVRHYYSIFFPLRKNLKNPLEYFFDLDWGLRFLGGTQVWRAHQANHEHFFSLSHSLFHLLKNKPINTEKKLILNCIHFPAENICVICVITTICCTIHYFCRGYLIITLLSPDPLKLVIHGIQKHGADKYASWGSEVSWYLRINEKWPCTFMKFLI